jgi:ATP/maltotriose-dependent transcriptional regulator MalT
MATAATPGVLPRPALEARLDETFGKRLTLIVAEAGYGKSTLLATWTADVASTWYTASAKDRGLSTLGAGIADSVALALGASDRWAVPPTAETVDAAEALAGWIARRLATELVHDLVLVVDDAHELRGSAPALRLVESLCRQGPPTLHVVLATREPLSLRTERLRVQGEVLELTSSDLAFTSTR